VTDQQIPPGWYPDAQGVQRYWDGYQWTDHVAGPATAPVHVDYQMQAARDEKSQAMLCQLLSIFFGWLSSLIFYLVAKPHQPFLKHHATESLNFQITVTLAILLCIPLMFVIVGIVLLPVVWIGALVFEIMATIAANRGEWYRYPVSIRFVSGARG
jgi:uncharacterized Tic20 family protein